mmetsp:Transcript_29819/g.40156  ORF Transcript_29819/g.40156 Transcript_29819/m.40156 type:complete len:231 (-) Transcript_29819:138-830(-)
MQVRLILYSSPWLLKRASRRSWGNRSQSIAVSFRIRRNGIMRSSAAYKHSWRRRVSAGNALRSARKRWPKSWLYEKMNGKRRPLCSWVLVKYAKVVMLSSTRRRWWQAWAWTHQQRNPLKTSHQRQNPLKTVVQVASLENKMRTPPRKRLWQCLVRWHQLKKQLAKMLPRPPTTWHKNLPRRPVAEHCWNLPPYLRRVRLLLSRQFLRAFKAAPLQVKLQLLKQVKLRVE